MAHIDVLIPHYSDPDGLRRSLASVEAQGLGQSVRVIIVDDGSPPQFIPAIEGVVSGYAGELSYHQNVTNLGRPATRNRLVALAEAPYVAWLDAGDTWYPDKLKLQLERFAQLEARGDDVSRVWVTCDYDWRWTGQEAKLVEQDVDSDQLRELLLGKRLRGYLWSILAPSRTFKELGPFDELLPRLQDLDVFIRFVAAGGIIDKPRLPEARALCVYEKSDIGRDAAQIRACNQRIFEKYTPLYRNYGNAFVRRTRVNAELLSVRFARNNGDTRQALVYLARAVLSDPLRAFREVGRKAFRARGRS